MVLNLPLDECIDNTHMISKEKRKTEKKQKEKLQQAIESRERQKTRSLEEGKSRTP
jgi:hypothetical protein